MPSSPTPAVFLIIFLLALLPPCTSCLTHCHEHLRHTCIVMNFWDTAGGSICIGERPLEFCDTGPISPAGFPHQEQGSLTMQNARPCKVAGLLLPGLTSRTHLHAILALPQRSGISQNPHTLLPYTSPQGHGTTLTPSHLANIGRP